MPTISELKPAQVTDAAARDVSQLMTQLADANRFISESELRGVAEANHLLVANDQNRIVGLVCLVPMHLPQGVRLWIESVIVEPPYRGAGLGRALMEAALVVAGSYGEVPVSLTSNPTRAVAHGLFESLGFFRADTSVFRRASVR